MNLMRDWIWEALTYHMHIFTKALWENLEYIVVFKSFFQGIPSQMVQELMTFLDNYWANQIFLARKI